MNLVHPDPGCRFESHACSISTAFIPKSYFVYEMRSMDYRFLPKLGSPVLMV